MCRSKPLRRGENGAFRGRFARFPAPLPRLERACGAPTESATGRGRITNFRSDFSHLTPLVARSAAAQRVTGCDGFVVGFDPNPSRLFPLYINIFSLYEIGRAHV